MSINHSQFFHSDSKLISSCLEYLWSKPQWETRHTFSFSSELNHAMQLWQARQSMITCNEKKMYKVGKDGFCDIIILWKGKEIHFIGFSRRHLMLSTLWCSSPTKRISGWRKALSPSQQTRLGFGNIIKLLTGDFCAYSFPHCILAISFHAYSCKSFSK